MAVEQYFQEAVTAHELDREEDRSSPLPKWKSISSTEMSTENANGGFDCNICLDFARDPVVTLCGHLYCWPCIYKWLHLQRPSPTQEEQQQQLCPVCKAVVTPTTLVPLYGRSQEALQTENEGKGSLVIPRRPTACGVHALISATASTTSPPDQNSYYNHSYQDQPRTFYGREYYPNYGHYTTEMTNLFHPMMGMFGEMIYERLFGSLCPYPNSYHQRVRSSARVRRMEMQADKSLNRLSIFLFCCFLSCLLFF